MVQVFASLFYRNASFFAQPSQIDGAISSVGAAKFAFPHPFQFLPETDVRAELSFTAEQEAKRDAIRGTYGQAIAAFPTLPI